MSNNPSNLELPLPSDPILRAQLEEKLKEYRRREAGTDKPWAFREPEFSYRHFDLYRFNRHKIEVLSSILQADLESKKSVFSWDLSMIAVRTHGRDFDEPAFNNAIGVIASYLGLELGPMTGKTKGLPKISAASLEHTQM